MWGGGGGGVGMRVMGWGWLWCRYVLGSSLEPGPHHYSPAADDTDPLSNLSPGADHGRLPLHRMPDWYSPHPSPHVLNLHPHYPPPSTVCFYYPTQIHCFISSSAQEQKLWGDEELRQKTKSLFQMPLFPTAQNMTPHQLIHKRAPLALQSAELKSHPLLINNVNITVITFIRSIR